MNKVLQQRLVPLLVIGALLVAGVVGVTLKLLLDSRSPNSAVARSSPSVSGVPLDSSPSPTSGLPTQTSPTPTPSHSPSPTPKKSPAAKPPAPVAAPRSAPAIRGMYRFTSTEFAAMHAAGFNVTTDGGVQDLGSTEAAAGLTGMVWVDAYSNTACTQTMADATIKGLVQANVNAGRRGLRYQIGDEPTANGCLAQAPVIYRHITALVHGVDSRAKTWVADDQFQSGNPLQSGIPMKGTVDILAFDVYPCRSGPCDIAAIDSAVRQIHAARLTNWEFIIQDFSSSPWRWPTPTEILTQFAHWKNQGAIGYWVFAWDYQGQRLVNQPGNLAALKKINNS
jgi:hypothetical protein